VRERYAFLPREAVTKFVASCPECRGSPDIDLSLPITATYLQRMRSLGRRDPFTAGTEPSYGSAVETDVSDDDPAERTEVDEETRDDGSDSPDERDTDSPLDMSKDFEEKSSTTAATAQTTSVPANNGVGGAKRRRETPTPDTMSAREDEDDDEEDLETADPNKYDPERLKAFNMFVRLFVDENLDRIVPISRQPKEKVQAIMDSCARQFPEFADRARKRIRTYLKSCRRHKRTRDQSGWEVVRSAPPHLTSPQAEQILAQACENETLNAKRMRLGLKPIPTNMVGPSVRASRRHDEVHVQGPVDALEKSRQDCKSLSFIALSAASPVVVNGGPPGYKPVSAKPLLHHHLNGNSVGTRECVMAGATDLSVKRSPPAPKYGSELLAVKQLIAGYRESAAFLLRSADELEHLLLQQQPN
ncbi:NOL4, partial [Cordylochernes scorpioides]